LIREAVEIVVAVLQPTEYQPQVALEHRALQRIRDERLSAAIEFGEHRQKALV
jgi:hypothetical protein